MIVFCEDCGQKNDMDPAAFADGRAIFRCTACGYPNAYAVQTGSASSAVEHLFASFSEAAQSFPGIIGTILYHEKTGLVEEKMPEVLTRSDVEILARGLCLSYTHGVRYSSDLTRMTVLISDKYFTVSCLGNGFYAVIVSSLSELPVEVDRLVRGLDKGLC